MGFVVAIDGPAGTGKGTITKLVAEKLGLINIDTGAMYRAVTLAALENNIREDDLINIEKLLNNINIRFEREDGDIIVFLNNKNVTKEIREQRINENVSKYSAVKIIRDKMTMLQRNMKQDGNIIMEGRDIGTAVFPNAEVKIYLDASSEVRAKRRYKQNLENGIDTTYEEVLKNIEERNRLDSTRKINPLRKADDAVLVDSSNLTIPEVEARVLEIIKEKIGEVNV